MDPLSVERRKLQECVANLLASKDELAKGLYGLFKAYMDAGFNESQSLYLIGLLIKPTESNEQ